MSLACIVRHLLVRDPDHAAPVSIKRALEMWLKSLTQVCERYFINKQLLV